MGLKKIPQCPGPHAGEQARRECGPLRVDVAHQLRILSTRQGSAPDQRLALRLPPSLMIGVHR